MNATPPCLVPVPKAAFAFCRYSIAVMIWVAWWLQLRWLIVVALAILAASALLGVRHAPLVVLYSATLGRLFSSASEDLDVRAMRFAHTVGAVFALICVVLLYWVTERAGWRLVFVFALMKTISAVGLCPAAKLFGCMTSGTCCAVLRKKP